MKGENDEESLVDIAATLNREQKARLFIHQK
jgi:hypothetical protein